MIKLSVLKADFLMLFVTLIAASGWMFTKEALEGFSPLTFMGLRFTLAALLLGVITKLRLKDFNRKQFYLSILIGFIFAVAMVFWVLGVAANSHIGEGAFITSLGMVLVPWVGWLFFGSSLYWFHQLAMAIGAFGLALLMLDEGFNPKAEQLYFLGAALLLAVHFVLNSRVSVYTSSKALASLQLFVVGVVCSILSVVFEFPLIDHWGQALTLEHWVWLALSIVIATSFRFLIQIEAQGIASANHAALIMILEPVWAALFAMIWFAETMSGVQVIGCMIIFIALIVGRIESFKSLVR